MSDFNSFREKMNQKYGRKDTEERKSSSASSSQSSKEEQKKQELQDKLHSLVDSSNSKKNTNNFSDFKSKMDEKYGNVGGKYRGLTQEELEKTIGFDTIDNDLTSTNNTIKGIYDTWQSNDYLTSSKSSVENMYNRLVAYDEYRKKYGNDDFTDVSDLVKSYKSVLDEWETLSNAYGGYTSAEEYNKAYEDYINSLKSPSGNTTPSDATFWEIAGNSVMSGLGTFNKGLASTLNFIMPTDFLGKYDPFAWLNDYYSGQDAYYKQKKAESLEGKSGTAKVLADIGEGVVAALPNAMLAIMTSGASASTSLGTTSLGTAASSAGTLSTAGNLAKEMVKNPMYWSSMAQTLGTDYEEAKADGANDFVATCTAIIKSGINAGIEIGGGVETLPNNLKGGDTKLIKAWVISMLEEGKEEVVQGIVSEAVDKIMFDHNKEILSLSNQNAIINPQRMAQEFGMGAAVGGVLGGGQTALISGANALSRYAGSKTTPQETEKPITELDPLEKAAMEVVASRNATESENSAPTASVSNVGEQTPTKSTNGPVAKNMTPEEKKANALDNYGFYDDGENVTFNFFQGKDGTSEVTRNKVSVQQEAKATTEPTKENNVPSVATEKATQKNDVSDLDVAKREAEAKATKAAFDAGKMNVPRESLTFETQAQEESYNAGRVEHIKNMDSDKSSRNNIENAPKQEYNVSEKVSINKSNFNVVEVSDTQYDDYGVKLYPRNNLSESDIIRLENDLREKLKSVPDGEHFSVTTAKTRNGEQVISVTSSDRVVLDSDLLFDDVNKSEVANDKAYADLAEKLNTHNRADTEHFAFRVLRVGDKWQGKVDAAEMSAGGYMVADARGVHYTSEIFNTRDEAVADILAVATNNKLLGERNTYAANTNSTSYDQTIAEIEKIEKKKREIMSRYGLTIDEADAVVTYKESESYKINAKLREDEASLNKYQQEIIKHLDSALEKLPQHKGKVYRTVSFDDVSYAEEEYNTFIEQHTAGSFVAYKAYTSASSKIDGHPMPDNTKYGVMLEIEGESGRDVEGFGNNFEKEVVYPRGCCFVVTEVSTDSEGIPYIKIKETQGNVRQQGHTEERSNILQQMQTAEGLHSDLYEVSERNTVRGSDTENTVQGVQTNNGGINNVHKEVLGGESNDNNGVRESEPVQKTEKESNAGTEDRKPRNNVSSENGTDVQASERAETAERPNDSRDNDNGVRESDNGDGDSGVGTRGNDNVNDEVKAKDFAITKAIAEDIDAKAPSVDDNINAIKVLQELESSGKSPTKAQQGILAKFKGWGGLASAFWRERSRLQEIMSAEEIAAAQSTVNDAYFTPTNIIDGVYKALAHLGFEGGNILEPSMGVGNFFGRLPKSIKDNSSLFGVEIDTISGRIAQYLYPSAKIEVAPFQDVAYKDGAFDLIVGNVPFGEVKYKYKGNKYLIHDYFFVKAMDKLNDGGVLAFLTSRGTLDKMDSKARAELNSKGKLIAAYRLPSSVFSRSANANVVTDLIIMQKSTDGNGERFVNLGNVNVLGEDLSINEYFVNHPENVIGELSLKRNWHNNTYELDVKATGDVAEQLAKAIKKLPKGLLNGTQTVGSVDVTENTAPMNTFTVKESGSVEYIDAQTGEVNQLKGKSAEVAKAYIKLKTAYQALIDSTLADAGTDVIESRRKALNTEYDGFVKKYGTLDKNKKVLTADNDYVKLSGLEVYDTKTKSIIKSEMFTKDTLGKRKPKKADSALDALSISIGETGGVNLARISELTGLSESEVVKQLEDRIVYTPDGTYELNEIYLSGNVREKYEAVKGKKGFEKNEQMLKAVIPEDIPAKNITPQFGAPWIQPNYVADFLAETLHLYRTPTVSYDPTTGTWSIQSNAWGDNTLMTNKYGTKYMDALKLAEKALNMRRIVVKDSDTGVVDVRETRAAQQKAEDIKAAFEEWCFKDAKRRQELVANFNEKFNSHRNMDFSELSKYLTFDGLSETFKLRDYQKRAVARAIFNGNTLLAHGVGTGKTAEMITIAMELKRMGIAKKNMMVVPPHKVADFRNDILKMYPSAKVIMLEKGANATQRQRFYAQVAANDFDIVVIPHSSFGMLDVSTDTKTAFISNQIAELEEVLTNAQLDKGKNLDGRFIRQLEKQKKTLEEKLKAITESQKDSGNTFEELGIDSLFVDEAHNFKNLPFSSKLSRVAGVSVNQSNNKTRASRAENMFMITDYLNRNNGRITFGTATPITNSMSEIYNMTRFLRPDILADAGIQSFDAWASMFGSIVNQAEVDPSGRHMRMKERFSKFKNVSQMVEMFRRMADILKTGDVIQELPKAERIDVVNEPNAIQEEFLDIVDEMIDEIRSSGQNAQHNMLEVTTAGQMAAIDLRFVESYFEGKYTREELNIPNNRVTRVAENVIKEYNDSKNRKGTQFVFCDVGITDDPTKKYNLHVYGDLINKLVAGGIPSEEIAVAQDFEDKADLSAKVNTGEIRVLIGSTAVMGEGMNAQNKAVALHHMTVPARPSDIEQREGRIIRYGNENKDVRIYRYIQEKSYDSYQWQMQERKAAFINQALSGGTVEELEEMSDFQLTAREAKAIASGNPLLLEKIEVEDKLNKLKSLRAKFNTDKLEMQDRLAVLPSRISKLEKSIANTKTDINTINANATDDFEITFGKTKFTERAEAAKALEKAVSKVSRNGTSVLIGSYRGLDVYYSSSIAKGIKFTLKGSGEYVIDGGESALGNITRIINAVDKIPSNLEGEELRLKNYKSEIETLKTEVTAEFPQLQELESLQTKLNYIDTQLGINVSEVDMSDVVVGEEDDGGTDSFIEPDEESDSMWTTTRVGENKKPKSISELVATIEHEFGINITTGHIRGKGVLGKYEKNSHGIRTKIANNLPVISHELGHYFERTFGIKEQLTEEMTNELTSQLDTVATEKYSDEQLVREGVAEYVRRFLQNRETAAIDYPLFNDFFLKCFTAKDLAKFEQLADDINAYYSLDADTATSSIRLREEGGIDLRTPVEKLKDTASTIYQAFTDSNHAIKRFDIATGSNAYMFATNAAYSDAIAGQIVTGDLTDKNGKYISSGLKSVLHGIDLNNKEEYRLFGEYLVVKHGPERLKEGMRVFADDRKNSTAFMERRQAELEAQYPQFKEVSERLYDFIKKFYKAWGVETGLISEGMLENWGERWEFYVPFNRAVSKEQSGAGAKRGFANQNSTIKKAKGGGQDIYNPVDNLINNIIKMVNAGTRNNVMLTITDSAEKLGADATFLEKVPMPLSVTKMDMTGVKEQLTDWLEESDLDEKSKTKAEGVVNNLDDILLQFGRGKAGGNVVTVLKNGTPQAWKINDVGLLESLTSLSPKTMGGLLDAYAVMSRFMTANITGNNIVWSIFSNLPRDFATFFTYSKNKNVAKMAKGVGSAYLNKVKGDAADPLYKEFLAMGGGKTSAYTADRNLTKDMRKTLARKTSDNLLKKIDYNPLDWIGFASDIIEAGPRFATYKMMREAGMTPQEAFYEAMDITTNFRRSGRIFKELNKVVPFFNASVQGLDKFRRWITAEELAGKPERKKAIRGRALSYIAVSAALAAIFYAINSGDEEKEEDYEQLSTYIKNSYWVIPLGDGKYFAIPKPREIGVLSSFMECCMEYGIGKNDHAFDEFYAYASENFIPPLFNDLAQIGTKGVKETMGNAIGSLGMLGVFSNLNANRDFLGRPIVASGLQNLEKKDQYTERTSKIAYWLGQAFNGSPEEIDYFMQQVLGGWWKGQKALFPVGEKNVDWTLGVGNTYIKDNQYSTDLTNWLYDRADTTARAKKSDPNNIDKAIIAKWDSNMTDFYGTYYKKAKNADTTAIRSTRQTVLDMIREYQKGIDGNHKTDLQEAVEAVCKAKNSTEYLPSVMSGEVTDGNGNKHNLSDVQYVEYQTDYLRLYWETVEDTMTADMTTAEKARILIAAKQVAREQATERTLKRIGAPSSAFATKYSGVDNDVVTEFLAGIDLANDDKSVKKSEVVDIISNMNINDDDAWTMYFSKYDDKAAHQVQDSGVDAKSYMKYLQGVSKAESDGKLEKREVVDVITSMKVSNDDAWALYLSEYEAKKDLAIRDAGIGGKDYMTVLQNVDKYDKPNDNGKLGTYTNDEITNAVKNTSGLSKEERAVLWQELTGSKSTKNNPWRSYLPSKYFS